VEVGGVLERAVAVVGEREQAAIAAVQQRREALEAAHRVASLAGISEVPRG